MAEVQRDDLLVAIQDHEVQALALYVGWQRTAVIPLPLLLNLHHLRPHVTQQHSAEKTGEHAREVENLDPLQWTLHDANDLFQSSFGQRLLSLDHSSQAQFLTPLLCIGQQFAVHFLIVPGNTGCWSPPLPQGLAHVNRRAE